MLRAFPAQSWEMVPSAQSPLPALTSSGSRASSPGIADHGKLLDCSGTVGRHRDTSQSPGSSPAAFRRCCWGTSLILTAPKVRGLLVINCFSSLLKSNEQLSIFVMMVGFERQQIPHLYLNVIQV